MRSPLEAVGVVDLRCHAAREGQDQVQRNSGFGRLGHTAAGLVSTGSALQICGPVARIVSQQPESRLSGAGSG